MNSVPLTDVLPWGDTVPTSGRTVLICDSTETDGRFLLHALASQCLSSPSSSSSSSSLLQVSSSNPIKSSSTFRRNSKQIQNTSANSKSRKVLWIHCGSQTDHQLRMAMKKAGCDSNSISTSSSQLYILNVMNDLCENLNVNEYTNNNDDYVYDSYLKNLYLKIKQWVKNISKSTILESSKDPLIILDNVTLLSIQFGSKATYALIQKLQALIRPSSLGIPFHNRKSSEESNNNNISRGGCLAVLCSNDIDQEYYLNSTQQSHRNTNVTGGKIVQYIGGSGRGILCDSEEMSILEQRSIYELEQQNVWERSLIEISDGIVDVVPLTSGFARDVHGRLLFTERLGSMGWKDANDAIGTRTGGSMNVTNTRKSNFSTTVVNFCCHDNGVRAIRLRV